VSVLPILIDDWLKVPRGT